MQFTEKAVCYGVSVTPSIRSNFPEIYLPNLGLTDYEQTSTIDFLNDLFPVQMKVGEKRVGIICSTEIVST